MIKIFCYSDSYLEDDYEKVYNDFPLALKEKVDKRNGDKRGQTIFVYHKLQELLNISSLDKLKFTENGKPYIEGGKYFNISHSENVICIGVSSVPIGVDVQKLIPYNEKLAKRICNEKELKALSRAKNKDLVLTKFWTKKESLIKCKGETIAQDLAKVLDDTKGFKFRYKKFGDFVICSVKN